MSEPKSLCEFRSLGELLATIASEASNYPFIGSDEQKGAWDEIKARFAKLERDLAALMDASFVAYQATGADTDGDNEWHCTVNEAGNALVGAVRQLRRDYDGMLGA